MDGPRRSLPPMPAAAVPRQPPLPNPITPRSMSRLEELVNNHAQELVDGLLALVRPVLRTPGGRRLIDRAPIVLELLDALQDQAEMSDFGQAGAPFGSLVAVRGHQSPEAAGATVGLSARHVRRLCTAGHVAHQRIGTRGYLVDVNDLRRHLRGKTA